MKSDSTEVTDVVPEFVAALEDPAPAVRLEAARALYVFRELDTEAKHLVLAMARLIREESGTYRLDCAVLPEHESNGSERPRADTTRAIELEYSKRALPGQTGPDLARTL